MNMPSPKEANSLASIIVGGILTVMGGILLYSYETQGQKLEAQSQRLSEHDKSIGKLEVEEEEHERDAARVDAAVGSINQSMTAVLGEVQGLRSGSEAQTNVLHDLQKRFDDLDSVLRPLHPPGR